MKKPHYLVSGLALGVTLAAPCASHAEPLEPPLLQTTVQPPANAPAAAAPSTLAVKGATVKEDTADATKASQPDDADASNDDDDEAHSTSAQKQPDAAPPTQDADDDNDNDSDEPNPKLPPELAEQSELPPTDGKPIPLTLGPLPADEADNAPPMASTPAPAAAVAAVAAVAGAQVPAAPAPSAPTATDDNALDEPALTSPLAQELVSGFYSRINALGYGILQDPINSTLNPNNALAIARYQTALDFRPDFSLNFRQLELGIKPRFEASWSRVTNGVEGGTDLSTATAYINEWIARYRVTNQLLVSYGRENLQWGPSQLLSPSNPFNQNNGKNNPAIEQPGQDYARVVVIPNSSLTGSFIANTGEGRLNDSGEETGPFHKAYAGKFDYTGDRTWFSLVVSKRETTPWRIGYFGGWNVSDALLAYSEGSAALSHDPTLPHPDYDVLVGATYTLLNGATITGEYFHHNAGCTQEDIAQCVSPQNLDPTNPYPRRDYLLLQYVDTKLVRNVSLTVRVIQDLNDHSTEFVSDLEYEMGQNWLLYFVPSVTIGSKNTEFGSLVRYSIFAGVSFTF
jgi:hypothetical protein